MKDEGECKLKKQPYFYYFLVPISKELAYVARELENSIYSSPRTMLTHSRIFIETILKQVIFKENLINETTRNLKAQIDLLQTNGYVTKEVLDALHHIRKAGNEAAHQVRPFRFSESLLAWESVYTVVKWYVEVYGPFHIQVPDYVDPIPAMEQQYERSEVEARLERLEQLLMKTLVSEEIEEITEGASPFIEFDEEPGLTIIRTIRYKDEKLDIPYFLRDAFLLPQRFNEVERFLIRLSAEQQARIMSELPDHLEGLHTYVSRYNESHDADFFQGLKRFVAEEKTRFILQKNRLGELFFFYRDKYIVVTEKLANLPISTEEFNGFPGFIKQLNEQGFTKVGQLPSELVTLAKYKRVGDQTIQSFFNQLNKKA